MSDFGLFESDDLTQREPRAQARTASLKLEAAIDQVRRDFGRFLMGATGIDEFGDRWHLSKNDIRKTVEAHVFPNTGTMRRIHNAMKADWKLAHPYKVALSHEEAGFGSMPTEDTHRNLDTDETYHPSSGNLVPEGDFAGYKDSVDQDGPEKVQNAFTPGGDSGTNKRAGLIPSWEESELEGYPEYTYPGEFADEPFKPEWKRRFEEDHGKGKEAARLVADIYTDFARANGLRVASLDTLEYYAATGIADADYRLLQALIVRQAESDCEDDEEKDEDTDSEAPEASESDESDSGDDDAEDYDFGDEDDAEGDDAEGDDGESEDDDFGGDDEGGGEQYTVPDHAPELPPEMMQEIPQDDPSGSAPVPPEVIDSLLGLPEGTIEQLLLEEVEQGGAGDPGISGAPMLPEGDSGMGAPQGGGDDFFGGDGDDAEQEQPPRTAHRRRRANMARRFWAAEGDQEQESEGGGDQAAPAQDPTAMGGMDPAMMGGGQMMPPPGSQAVQPPAPPAPVEDQPAEDALLDTANQAIMQMIDRETQEYQQIIDPLSQALQAIQFAQQVEQAEHPMDVTPPQGTVDVSPSAAPGGQPPMQQTARRRHAGGDPYADSYGPVDRGGPSIDDPTNGPTYQRVHPDIEKALRRRFDGGGSGAWHPDKPGVILHDLGNFWDGPRTVKHLGGGELEYTCPYTGRSDRFNAAGYYTHDGEHRPWSSDHYGSMRRQAIQFTTDDEMNQRRREQDADWWNQKYERMKADGKEDQYHQELADYYKNRQTNPFGHTSSRQAKVDFALRNAAALIARKYRLSATGHQMLVEATLGRRGYEHVVEALKLVPPEVRKAAAIHMSHLFAAGNQRFNRDVFMKTVMAGTARERHRDKAYSGPRDKRRDEHGDDDLQRGLDDWGDDMGDLFGGGNSSKFPNRKSSRGRLPFDRPRRTAGETWVNTPTKDAFEFPNAGQTPRVDDNIDINDLPVMKGADPHGKNAASQKAVDRFQRWQERQRRMGLPTTEGESAVHNFLQTTNPLKKRVGPDAQNMIHEHLGLQPDAVKTPKPKVPKAVNPTLKGKGGKTPAAPKAKAPAPKAAPKAPKAAAQRTASFFTRKVPGWRWDDHLNGYISKEAKPFACSCGQKVAAPSYRTCSCGKVWNITALGSTQHLASDTADFYVAREIPVRPGVILAGKNMESGIPSGDGEMASDSGSRRVRGVQSRTGSQRGSNSAAPAFWATDPARPGAQDQHRGQSSRVSHRAPGTGQHPDGAHADGTGISRSAGGAAGSAPQRRSARQSVGEPGLRDGRGQHGGHGSSRDAVAAAENALSRRASLGGTQSGSQPSSSRASAVSGLPAGAQLGEESSRGRSAGRGGSVSPEDCRKMRLGGLSQYHITTPSGTRIWHAESPEHAVEQHSSAFEGDPDEEILDIQRGGPSSHDDTPPAGMKRTRPGPKNRKAAIGDTHHLASDTADMFIAREIEVRPGVIMANRKLAGGYKFRDEDDADLERTLYYHQRKKNPKFREQFPSFEDYQNYEPPHTARRKTAKDGECTCWEGYERVPGTEPCASKSCRKKSSRLYRENLAMIDKLADWTKYDDDVDPTVQAYGKSKIPSTKAPKIPRDWSKRQPDGKWKNTNFAPKKK